MTKIKGFLMAESLLALIISILAVSCLYLTVANNQQNGQELNLRVDRAYAYHTLKQSNLKQITVHDHLYELIGHNYVYDRTTKQKFEVNQ